MDTERGPFLPSGKTRLLMHSLRTNTRAIITATVVTTLLLSGLLYASDAPRAALRFMSPGYSAPVKQSWPTECSPEEFSDGAWELKSPESYPLEHFLSLYPYNASDPDAMKKVYSPTPEVARDPLAPLGFSGCASGRERDWHLGMHDDGTPDQNHPDLWEYVVRGASYDWVPKSKSCRKYNEKVEAEDFVTMLVERGGWFFVGDSVTEQHFFSMSCLLYPHVRATPDYGPTGGSGPRDWPQHLYLNPSSPLVSELNPPTGFDMNRTPLVTFRRVDLLFDKPELDSIHRAMHSNASGDVPDTLFGPGASESYNLSPKAYLEQFMQPLPEGNYRRLIVSTAGHWTTGSLPGARDPENTTAGATNPGVYKTFAEAVRVWTHQVSGALLTDTKDRQVLIRAYLPGPGHEYDCHKEPGPITEVRTFSQEWYNWSWIGRMNEAFKAAIADKGDSKIKFLGLDRMALLRPDAHALSDCLHIQVGAGIFEGWSRYIWHFGQDTVKPGRTRLGRIR
ncbi:unnamed protein product [Rhizoctonia solani]|uniref:Uncharacterized protein n=1 Tax=Rhizoctonia solani TaxID=456999 RepID=A0A8H2WAB1_9AGAM|nr:unnamed protein product [Rhizoctonia solani]